MASEKVLKRLVSFFYKYVDGFPQEDPDIRINLRLKRDHSFRVCSEIRRIASRLRLDRDDTALAEICALLHDIGRFEQYCRYRTFMDPVSVDHGDLGVEIIDRLELLQDLSRIDREAVRAAVAGHNKLSIAPDMSRRARFFSMLVRDADKLDIWHLVIEYYASGVSNEAVELGLSHRKTISPRVMEALMAGQMAKKEDFQTLNDAKINQIAWVYDLNFACSLERAREQKFLPAVFSFLDPDLPGVTEFYCRAQAFVYGNGSFSEEKC